MAEQPKQMTAEDVAKTYCMMHHRNATPRNIEALTKLLNEVWRLGCETGRLYGSGQAETPQEARERAGQEVSDDG